MRSWYVSFFLILFCHQSTPWNGYKNVTKEKISQGILVIRETPLYEHPIENKKYQIGICNEGTLFDINEEYTNTELTSRSDIARIYYKVSCENKVGYIPFLGSYSYLNLLQAKSAKELAVVDWKAFKTLSIFQEQISGERYLTESDLSFVIYGDFEFLKSATVWLEISDHSDTIYNEPFLILKMTNDRSEFTLLSKKNETVTISRINEKYSKISGVSPLNDGKEIIVQRYDISKDWNSYKRPLY